MTSGGIKELVDRALMSGTVEAECTECGITIQCEASALTAWCDQCEKTVKVVNPLTKLGFI